MQNCDTPCFSSTDERNNRKDEKSRRRKAYFQQFLAISSGYIIILNIGAQLGWTSPALPHLSSENSEFYVSRDDGRWLASIINISGIIGCVCTSVLINRIGRRYTLLFFILIHLISWILVIFSYNFTFLMVARTFVGFCSGGTLNILSIYIGETSSKEMRGTFLSILKIFMNCGVFFINALGAYLPYNIMNIIMILFPIIALCLGPFILETSYYHLQNDRDEEAIKTLMKLSGIKKREMVIEDIERIKEALIESQKSDNSSIRELFCDRGSRRAFIGLTIAELTYVLSGHLVIQSYAQEILSYSGSSLKPGYAAMILTGVQIFAGIPSSQLSDRWGRRYVFLISGLMTAFLSGILGLFYFFKFYLETDMSGITWIPLAILILYQFTCSIGLAPITSIYPGELFSFKVKGVAVALTSSIASIGMFIVKHGLHSVNDKFGIYTTFWIFACSCIIGPILVLSILPETKGKNLEEITELLRGGKKVSSSESNA